MVGFLGSTVVLGSKRRSEVRQAETPPPDPVRPPARAALARRLYAGAVVVVATLMLAVTLVPAEAWHQPSADATYSGFDRNLVYAATADHGGEVAVSSSEIRVSAPSDARPAVLLATTLMPKFRASVVAMVLDNQDAEHAVRVGVWSPWTQTGVFVDFGPAPQNRITIQTLTEGSVATTLEDGKVARSIAVGTYSLATPYTIDVDVDRQSKHMTFRVSGEGLSGDVVPISLTGLGDLMSNVQMSLSASSEPGKGTARAALTEYRAVIPHQRWWADQIDDLRIRFLMIALGVLGAFLLLLSIGVWVRGRTWRRPQVPSLAVLAIAAVMGLVYLAGNVWLFRFGGHPFDLGAEKYYAYVANTYGLTDLFYLPNLVSQARIWDGVPYVETAFPYGPTFAYVAAWEGWLYNVLVPAGGGLGPTNVQLEYVIKSTNVVFGLADGLLIYAILRQIGSSTRWSVIGAALFLFNPAVWYSMSIWGQTHVISLFFVLLALWFAEKRFVALAWLALAAATMTRPQMIVFAFIVGIVFLRKFTWRENLSGVALAVIATFVAILPMTFGTSPSLPVDVTFNNFHIQEAGGNGDALSPVSQGGFSIWPLVTYLVAGQVGVSRTFVASSEVLVGGLTYQQIAQVLTVLALVVVAVILGRRRRSGFEAGGYLPEVALAIALFLMLITGVVATHFVLALPFLILSRRWMTGVSYWFVVIAWTVTTFVPMYGEMGAVLSRETNPLLEPGTNRVTQAFVRLYSWDRFISVAVTANLCAIAWLAAGTFGRARLIRDRGAATTT